MFSFFKENKPLNAKDLEIFFITFDEPLKDQSWELIKAAVPAAKRVDSVKGFDKAYKACAEQVVGDRFLSIDGDNELLSSFHNLQISKELLETPYILSWSAANSINGLCYGNGGVKCWPTKVAHEMQSHENAKEEKAAVDFYFEIQYYLMPETLSVSNIHHTPYQAFRAGYREGIKMALIDGEKLKVDKEDLMNGKLVKKIPKPNLERLKIWCSIGQDIQNGLWAIYGARRGLSDLYLKDMPLENIRDYDWFNDFWKNDVLPEFEGVEKSCTTSKVRWSQEKLQAASIQLKKSLNKELKIDLADFNSEQSQFFKSTYRNRERKGLLR